MSQMLPAWSIYIENVRKARFSTGSQKRFMTGFVMAVPKHSKKLVLGTHKQDVDSSSPTTEYELFSIFRYSLTNDFGKSGNTP